MTSNEATQLRAYLDEVYEDAAFYNSVLESQKAALDICKDTLNAYGNLGIIYSALNGGVDEQRFLMAYTLDDDIKGKSKSMWDDDYTIYELANSFGVDVERMMGNVR